MNLISRPSVFRNNFPGKFRTVLTSYPRYNFSYKPPLRPCSICIVSTDPPCFRSGERRGRTAGTRHRRRGRRCRLRRSRRRGSPSPYPDLLSSSLVGRRRRLQGDSPGGPETAGLYLVKTLFSSGGDTLLPPC